MNAALRSLRCLGLLAGALLCRSATADNLPACRMLPIAVEDGRSEIVVPSPHANDRIYVVLGSLARGPGLHRVVIRSESTSDPVHVRLEAPVADNDWQARIHALSERLARAREGQSPGQDYALSREPAQRKVFYLFSAESDFANANSYVAIEANLQSLGRHCQVYVERGYASIDELQPTLEDVVQTFDNEIYPYARGHLGQVVDVDRDGRFTILFTSRLGKLFNGKVSLSGCVRGSDWYRELAAPFGNRCDMMYLNTDLKPGRYLHSILAHEYTHAILFSEHVFGNYLPDAAHQDEEAWLNEGLAHLVEDLHDYGWQNLDYRIAAFLSAPERFSLVVPDYYAAGSWRSPGHRGACYLFVRWCVDRYGEKLARKLIQSNLTGVTNLEVATGEHFSELFRQWSAALLLEGTNQPAAPVSPLLHVNLGHLLGSEHLNGPQARTLPMTGHLEIDLAGTTAAYIVLDSTRGGQSRIRITADPEAGLQVTMMLLPGRLEP